MNTSTTENQSAAAEGRDGKHHGWWGAAIAGGVIALLLVVLVVLPGFAAAGFSRMHGGYRFCINGEVCWDDFVFQPATGVGDRVMFTTLAPSAWIMTHWEESRVFYNRQYKAAGGENVSIVYRD